MRAREFKRKRKRAKKRTHKAKKPQNSCTQDESQMAVDERIMRLRQELEDDDDSLFEDLRSLPRQSSSLPVGSIVCIPEKAAGSPRVSLVLDLDETLVHSCMSDESDEGRKYDFEFDVGSGARALHRVHVLKRPHVQAFLARVSQIFEVIGAPPLALRAALRVGRARGADAPATRPRACAQSSPPR